MTIHARIALLRLRLEIEKAKGGHSGQARWPAGTPLGGQWKAGGGGLFGGIKQLLWGGSAGAMGMPEHLPSDKTATPAYIYPAKGSVKHPHKDDKGRDVHIHRPKASTPPGHWGGKDTLVTVTPGAPSPKSLNGIPFAKWNGPKDGDWTKVGGQNHDLESQVGPLEAHKWKYPSAGVIIKEPDGRIWLTSPTNGFGGYRNTFPKGTQEHGLTLQQTAIKEAWEETGLKVRITGVLGDFERTQSIARVYIAERVGGSPTHQGWESQAMRLAPRSAMKSLLNMPVDREITRLLWEEHDLTKARPGFTSEQINRLVEVIHRPLFKAKGGGGKGGKQGAWVNQPRWPAGTPLGGEWKSYDAAGLTKPPKIGSAANPGFQNKVNSAYASASAGEKDQAVLVLKPLELKAMQLGYNPSTGAYPSTKGLNSQQKWALQAHQYVNDLVGTTVKATVLEAKVTAASATPKLADYKYAAPKPASGSNPGAFYEKGGAKFYVKGANHPSDDRAKNEVLASKLMLAVGIQAPDMHLVDLGDKYGGGLGVASKAETFTGWSKSNAGQLEKAQSEFAVHAWLGNYDAVGTPPGDNLAMKDGQVFNYDPGGALLYRAQGLPKALPGGMLSPTVGEWDSMRNKSVNAAAASVYGSMTKDQLTASAQKLQGIDDKTIKTLVAAYGPGDKAKQDALATALIARRDDILAKAGLSTAAKPANVVMGSSMAGVVAAAQAAVAGGAGGKVAATPTPTSASGTVGEKMADVFASAGIVGPKVSKNGQIYAPDTVHYDIGHATGLNEQSGVAMTALQNALHHINSPNLAGDKLGQTQGEKIADKIKLITSHGGVPGQKAARLVAALAAAKGIALPAKASAAQKTAPVAQQSALSPSFEAKLTNTTEGHNKFYNVTVVGNEVTRNWGKIGTAGQTMTETFPNAQQAMIAGQALANGKLAKGYLGSKATSTVGLAAAPDIGGLMGQVTALGIHPNSEVFKQADKAISAVALKSQPAFDDAMKSIHGLYAPEYVNPTAKVEGQKAMDILNQAASQQGMAMFTQAIPGGGAAAPTWAAPNFGDPTIDPVAALQRTYAGNYGSNISAEGKELLNAAKLQAEAFGTGTAGALPAKFAIKLHDKLASAKTDADITAALKSINSWAPSQVAMISVKETLKAAIPHISVQMDMGQSVAAAGAMPKLSVTQLGKAPVIKGIVGAKYGVSTVGVNSAMYQGRSALLEGDLDKLNAAYAKLKEYKGKLPLGSKSAQTVFAAQVHLLNAVKEHTDLKLQSGKFVALGAVTQAAAQQATDPIAERVKEQSLKMLHEQTGFGGEGMLTTDLGKQVVAAHAALYSGDDKALATAIGTIATSGASSAMAITDKLTEMAEAKGGFPMATGAAAVIESKQYGGTGGAATVTTIPGEASFNALATPPVSMPPAMVKQPAFVAGVTSDTTSYYKGVADKMQTAYEAGDMKGLLETSTKAGGKPIWPVGKDGQPKTANGKLLKDYHTALVGALSQHQNAVTKAALDTPVAHIPEPGNNVGNLPAMPRFEKHKLDATKNTNAPSHNKKVDQIAALAAKGDVKGILSLKYGTNTYGKKQASIANSALAAMGSPFTVDPGQKKNSHPALTGGVTTASVAKTAALTEKELPPALSFANWNGQGKGLSSKPEVNAANQAAFDHLTQLAKLGDVQGIKDATVSINGVPTKIASQAQFVSQHLKGHQDYLLQVIDEKLNPPKPLEIFEAKMAAHSVAQLSAKFPPHKLGTTSKKVPSSQAIGHYIAIGQVKGHEGLVPKVQKDFNSVQVSQANSDYQTWKHDALANSFRSAVQGHGGHEYHGGWDSPSSTAYGSYGSKYTGQQLTDKAKAAHKWARKQPPGTKIYKWENLSADMKAKLEKAQPGLIIMNPAPSCASYSPTATKGFGPSHRWTFIYSEGAKGLESFASGSHPSEKEVTLLPNSRYMILSHSKGAPGKPAETVVLLLPPDPALDSDGYTHGYGY